MRQIKNQFQVATTNEEVELYQQFSVKYENKLNYWRLPYVETSELFKWMYELKPTTVITDIVCNQVECNFIALRLSILHLNFFSFTLCCVMSALKLSATLSNSCRLWKQHHRRLYNNRCLLVCLTKCKANLVPSSCSHFSNDCNNITNIIVFLLKCKMNQKKKSTVSTVMKEKENTRRGNRRNIKLKADVFFSYSVQSVKSSFYPAAH